MNSEVTAKKKEALKKVVLGIVALILLLCVILAVFWLIQLAVRLFFGDETGDSQNYVFYEPNYNENIFDDSVYMGLNRQIYNKDGIVSSTDRSYFSSEALFIEGLVNDIINGDDEAYSARFSAEFRRRRGDEIRMEFTMQKLYDIEIEVLGSATADVSDAGEKLTYTDIKLSYRIYHNNGTFRNDLQENGSRPVVYRLLTTENASGKTIEIIDLMLYSQYQ